MGRCKIKVGGDGRQTKTPTKKDKYIITDKELNYIETLYLYCNLDDFTIHPCGGCHDWLLGEEGKAGGAVTVSDINNLYDGDKYDLMMAYIDDTMLHSAEKLGKSNGRSWYQFENYRMGIMEYGLAIKGNQYNCIIQYEQHHMMQAGQDLEFLELPFGDDRDLYRIKRIDITKIFKSSVDYTADHGYISSYRSQANWYGTIYLGHRKNGNVFRMYNKTKQLEDTGDYSKADRLGEYFGDIDNLYTFELELSRNHLKEVLGIDKLSELEKVKTAYSNIVGKIKIYEDNDRNKALIKQKNRSRINSLRITEFKEYKRIVREKSKPNEDTLLKRLERELDKFMKSNKIDTREKEDALRLSLGLKLAVGLDREIESIEFKDTEFRRDEQKMKEKHEKLRGTVNNSALENEAWLAFGKPVPPVNNNPFLE